MPNIKPNNISAFLSQAPLHLLVAGVLLLSATTVTAQESSEKSRDDRSHRKGPPAEALIACEGLAAGESCSFVGRGDSDVSGQCITTPKQDIACAPAGQRPQQRRQEG